MRVEEVKGTARGADSGGAQYTGDRCAAHVTRYGAQGMQHKVWSTRYAARGMEHKARERMQYMRHTQAGPACHAGVLCCVTHIDPRGEVRVPACHADVLLDHHMLGRTNLQGVCE